MLRRIVVKPKAVSRRVALAVVGTAAVAALTASLVIAQTSAQFTISRSTFPGGAGRVSSGGPIVIEGSIGDLSAGSASGGNYSVRGGTFGETGPTIRGRVPMTASDGPQR